MADQRVSDQERDQAAEQIREHYAAGRLSEDELSERVQAVYDATTQDQLHELLADLPKLPATPAQQRAELRQRRAQLQRQLLQQSGGGLIPFVICTVIWVAAGAHGQFWPVWVLLVALIPLLRNGWRLYGPSPELDQVEHELRSSGQRDQLRSELRSELRQQHIERRRRPR